MSEGEMTDQCGFGERQMRDKSKEQAWKIFGYAFSGWENEEQGN